MKKIILGFSILMAVNIFSINSFAMKQNSNGKINRSNSANYHIKKQNNIFPINSFVTKQNNNGKINRSNSANYHMKKQISRNIQSLRGIFGDNFKNERNSSKNNFTEIEIIEKFNGIQHQYDQYDKKNNGLNETQFTNNILSEIKKQNKKSSEGELSNLENRLKKSENRLKKSENKLKKSEKKLKKSEKKLKKSENRLKKSENILKKSENRLKKSENRLKKSENRLKESENRLKELENRLKES